MSAVKSGHAEVEKKIIDEAHKQLKDIKTVVKQQTQKHWEFKCKLQKTWWDGGVAREHIKVTKVILEVTQHDLEATHHLRHRWQHIWRRWKSRDQQDGVKSQSSMDPPLGQYSTASLRPQLIKSGHPTRRPWICRDKLPRHYALFQPEWHTRASSGFWRAVTEFTRWST